MNRRDLLLGCAAVLATTRMGTPAFAASSPVLQALEDELAYGNPCQAEATALRNTIRRMKASRPPAEGARTLVVDLPSQNLAVYEGRSTIFESRVVVGDRGWETPDLETSVSYVRLNPTWTVPESILKARDWRGRLRRNPAYFEDLNFLVEAGGRMVRPSEAAASGATLGRFVQQPGSGNALGKAKIGLNAGNAIYLHDTQDTAAFDTDARTLSHGCVRVERIIELAAWTLGMSTSEVEDLVASDDRTDRRDFPGSVRVMTTYFTAWPDLDGAVRYYPDVYGRDGTRSRYCSGRDSTYRSSGLVESPVEEDDFPSEIRVIGR